MEDLDLSLEELLRLENTLNIDESSLNKEDEEVYHVVSNFKNYAKEIVENKIGSIKEHDDIRG